MRERSFVPSIACANWPFESPAEVIRPHIGLPQALHQLSQQLEMMASPFVLLQDACGVDRGAEGKQAGAGAGRPVFNISARTA